jgi:peptidoglycan/LPS O-acetylase OafA/YrhL
MKESIKMAGYLRFFLSLLVVVSHTGVSTRIYVGAVAVFIFFMLAGYVTTKLYNIEGMSYKLFIKERLLRILPLYYYASIIFICISYALQYCSPSLSVYSVFSLISVIPHDYWWIKNPVYFHSGEYANQFLNIPIWSLALELQAYFILPFLIKNSRIRFIVFISSFTIFILSNAGIFKYIGINDPVLLTIRLLPGTIFFFLIGTYIYNIKQDKYAKKILIYSTIFICLSLLLFLRILHIKTPYMEEEVLALVIGIPLVYIVTTVKIKSKIQNILGDSSYGIYITHAIVIYVIDSMESLKYLKSQQFFYTTTVFIGAFMLSIIGIYFIEKYIKSYRFSLINKRKNMHVNA